eukprot:3823262-Prymnesium_polylepis.1
MRRAGRGRAGHQPRVKVLTGERLRAALQVNDSLGMLEPGSSASRAADGGAIEEAVWLRDLATWC